MSFLASLCLVNEPWVALPSPRSSWGPFETEEFTAQATCSPEPHIESMASVPTMPGFKSLFLLSSYVALNIFLLNPCLCFLSYKLDSSSSTLRGCYED